MISIPASWPLETILSLAQLAEEAGRDVFWCLDIPPEGDGFIAQALVALHTSRIRLGVAGVDCAVRHPVIAVGAALTLDELSGGRVVLGFAGQDERAAEGILAAQAALRGNSFHGRHFTLEDGRYAWGRQELELVADTSGFRLATSPDEAAALLSR